jgi:hypothetical protein
MVYIDPNIITLTVPSDIDIPDYLIDSLALRVLLEVMVEDGADLSEYGFEVPA